MAAKALFTALDFDLFTRLAGGPKSLDALSEECAIRAPGLATLLTACVSVGLLTKSDDGYGNAPAAQDYLVRTAPRFFGDYYRLQIDRQMYPAFHRLTDALRGERVELYGLTQNDTEAEYFSRAQHSGSLGPAAVASKLVDLTGARSLLDVAGGSGAFSITFCRRFPELESTILDFPAVAPVAARFIGEAQLDERIRFLPGNALDTEWPGGQDAVLMSYLFSAVGGGAIPMLLARAFRALAPGGRLMVHDFMVDDDGRGPATAALWLLSGPLADPDAIQLTPGSLRPLIEAAGFENVRVHEVIPTITRMLSATRPDAT